MQIQISWLLQKPTDLDLHCLQRQGTSGFSRTRVKTLIVIIFLLFPEVRSLVDFSYLSGATLDAVTKMMWFSNFISIFAAIIVCFYLENSECQNNGLCRDHQCICASGWTGATCTVDIDECSLGNCVNSQSCQNTNGSYTCSCKEGFSGKNCDQDVDECQRFPCHNGSTCLNTYGGYLCLCSPYWKGTFCNETDYCNQDVCNLTVL